MTTLKPTVAAGALGLIFGLSHLIWAFLVAISLAKPLLDFILKLHFLTVSYSVTMFNFGTAILLVTVTTIFGWVSGYLFAVIWNNLLASERNS